MKPPDTRQGPHGRQHGNEALTSRLDELPALAWPQVARQALGLLRPHWRLVLTAGLLALLETGVGLAGAWGVRRLASSRLLLVAGPILGLALVAVLLLVGHLSHYLGTLVGERVSAATRIELLRRLAAWPEIELDRARRSGFASRLTLDLAWLREVVGFASRDLLGTAVVALGLGLAMFLVSWKLSLVGLAGLGVAAVPVAVLARRTVRAATQLVDESKRSFVLQLEVLENTALFKITGTVQEMAGLFADVERSRLAARLRLARLQLATSPTAALIGLLAAGATALLGWQQVETGRMAGQDLLGFLVLLGLFYRSAGSLASRASGMAGALGSLSRVLALRRILDGPDARDERELRPSPPKPGVLRFERVSFSYGEQQVFEGLEFAAEPGRLTVLVGPSGSGKTTALRLAAGLYPPEEGSVTWAGRPTEGLLERSSKGLVALLGQPPSLLSHSIRWNITLGRPAADEDLWAVLERVGLAEQVRRLPDGLDSQVGERGSRLSAGQRRRLCLARCLLDRPALLLADEPTEALDDRAARQVIEALRREAARGAVVLVATHDPRVREVADQVVPLPERDEPAADLRGPKAQE